MGAGNKEGSTETGKTSLKGLTFFVFVIFFLLQALIGHRSLTDSATKVESARLKN